MSIRWWNPLTYYRRRAPGAADAVPTVLLAPASATEGAAPVPTVPASDAQNSDPQHDSGVLQVRFFCWLLAEPGSKGTDPLALATATASTVARLFERLDEVIASETLRAALLPRAPHVVPQLMKTLRDENYSSVDVAARISRDVVLSAEVIRSASSVFRNVAGSGDSEPAVEGEIDLGRAVAVIGTQGLRRAIASVVLRPIFDGRGSTLSARAAVQIWKDADKKARLCAALAAEHELDPFDGYLAGLLHNTGWTAALRAIDGLPSELAVSPFELSHPDVVPLLLKRRDALFGALVGPWQLSRAVDDLAEEVGRLGLAAATSPLAVALREAVRLSAWHALLPAGHRPAASVPAWAVLARPVQNCYRGLAAV
ncbi:MAG: HDOD domain-containing protein [Caldimonas sp.]